jgi:hypothetical protein
MILKDGTGKGKTARVDNQNRLSVKSDQQPLASYHSKQQEAYLINSGALSVTATGGLVLWIRNDNSTKIFRPTRFMVSWNGGDTNHNRIAKMTMQVGTGVPSGNQTSVTPSNAYLGSTNPASMTAFKWDESGDGMTAVAGADGAVVMIRQGYTDLEITGLIVPNGVSMAAKIEPEEAGEFSIVVFGYFEDILED